MPSIAEVEEIAQANDIAKVDLGNRPNPIEQIMCDFCDNYGLIELTHLLEGGDIWSSCPECENGKKQEYWNKVNWDYSVKKHGREHARQTCPPFKQMKPYGWVPIRKKAERYLAGKNSRDF